MQENGPAGAEIPEIRLSRHQRYRDILARAAGQPAVPTAAVHPCSATSLGAVLEAQRIGLLVPILVGPAAKSGPPPLWRG